jgi:hypothetical protein
MKHILRASLDDHYRPPARERHLPTPGQVAAQMMLDGINVTPKQVEDELERMGVRCRRGRKVGGDAERLLTVYVTPEQVQAIRARLGR